MSIGSEYITKKQFDDAYFKYPPSWFLITMFWAVSPAKSRYIFWGCYFGSSIVINLIGYIINNDVVADIGGYIMLGFAGIIFLRILAGILNNMRLTKVFKELGVSRSTYMYYSQMYYPD